MCSGVGWVCFLCFFGWFILKLYAGNATMSSHPKMLGVTVDYGCRKRHLLIPFLVKESELLFRRFIVTPQDSKIYLKCEGFPETVFSSSRKPSKKCRYC